MKKWVQEWYVWENYHTAKWPLAVFENDYLGALFFAVQYMKDNGTKASVRGYGEDRWYYWNKDNERSEITLMQEDTYK